MKSEYGDIKLNTKDYIAWDNIEIETSALPFEEHIYNSFIEEDIDIPKFTKKYTKDDILSYLNILVPKLKNEAI